MRAGPVVVLFLVAACAGKSNNVGQSGGAPGTGGTQTTGGSGGKGGKGGTTATGGADTTGSGATGGSGGDAMSTGGSGGDAMSTGGSERGGTGAGDTGGTGGGDMGGTGAGDTGGTGAIGEGGMTNATGGTGGSSVPPITSCTDEFPFLGTWEGDVLDFFYEPMEELTLVVEETNGVVGGTLTYGEGDPPPPPESADIPYPPGFWDNPMYSDDISFLPPWPGYPYTVVRGAGCDSSFRFSISAAEIFGPWCALQTPIYSEGFGWGCTIRGGGSSSNTETCTVSGSNGQTATYPAWKCVACGAVFGGVCACDEAGCFANLEPTHTFDLTIAATTTGTVLSGPDSSCGDCTVRLELVE